MVGAAQRQLYTKASLTSNTKQGLPAEVISQYLTVLMQAAKLVWDKQLREFEAWLLKHTERELQTCVPGDLRPISSARGSSAWQSRQIAKQQQCGHADF